MARRGKGKAASATAPPRAEELDEFLRAYVDSEGDLEATCASSRVEKSAAIEWLDADWFRTALRRHMRGRPLSASMARLRLRDLVLDEKANANTQIQGISAVLKHDVGSRAVNALEEMGRLARGRDGRALVKAAVERFGMRFSRDAERALVEGYVPFSERELPPPSSPPAGPPAEAVDAELVEPAAEAASDPIAS